MAGMIREERRQRGAPVPEHAHEGSPREVIRHRGFGASILIEVAGPYAPRAAVRFSG